jgi:murein L,D-transpeptidase YcbB/YkuD
VVEASPASTSERIRHLLDRPDRVRIDGRPLDSRALGRFYRPREFAPAWDARDGGSERAALLLRALVAAARHGLDPTRYHLDAIRGRQASANGGHTGELDLLLTGAFVGYARDVRAGRLPPGRRDPDWGIAAASFDAVATLAEGACEPTTFGARLASLLPPAKEYGRLVGALQRYREVAARGDWRVPPGAPLRPGDDDIGRVRSC